MQPQTHSFEYQLTPESMGKVSIEAEQLLGVGFYKNRWKWPVIVGSTLAVLLFFQNYPFQGVLQIGDKDFSSELRVVEAIMLIVLGFGLGFGGVLFYRKNFLKRALRAALQSDEIKNKESSRMICWNQTHLSIASPPTWEGKLAWSEIEQIQNANFGIHIFAKGKIFYSIPKSILPVGFSADEIVQEWGSLMAAKN